MKKGLYLILVSLFLMSCSEKDNYAEPKEALQGALIDEETGDSIPSQQPNGLRIRLYDQQYSAPQPIDFYGKQDGSFKNTRLFAGKYKLIADGGAFHTLDTMNVELPLDEDIEIKALPYLRIKASAEAIGGNSIVVKSELTKPEPDTGNIERRAVLVNETPYVDFQNFSNDAPILDVGQTSDEELTNTAFKDTISGLESNETYFVRIGGMVDQAGSDTYNYSKIIEVDMPGGE